MWKTYRGWLLFAVPSLPLTSAAVTPSLSPQPLSHTHTPNPKEAQTTIKPIASVYCLPCQSLSLTSGAITPSLSPIPTHTWPDPDEPLKRSHKQVLKLSCLFGVCRVSLSLTSTAVTLSLLPLPLTSFRHIHSHTNPTQRIINQQVPVSRSPASRCRCPETNRRRKRRE